MSIRSRVTALATAAVLVATIGASALAQSSTFTLDDGSVVNARMQSTIDSGNAYVGERFSMQVIPPFPGGHWDLNGAIISGRVIKVTHAGTGVKPELDLAFDTMTLQNGTSYPIDAQMTGGGTKQDMRNGGHVALTSIGGMLLGNAIGKTIFHSSLGGAVGLIGGFLVGYNKKSNIALTSGTDIQLTLVRPLVVRRQASRPYPY